MKTLIDFFHLPLGVDLDALLGDKIHVRLPFPPAHYSVLEHAGVLSHIVLYTIHTSHFI